MVLHLHLGKDLKAEYPAALRQIANPDLNALLAQINPIPDSTRGSGAVGWADLPDRLYFIVELFRCYADTADLFEPPFTPERTAQLKAGASPCANFRQPRGIILLLNFSGEQFFDHKTAKFALLAKLTDG